MTQLDIVDQSNNNSVLTPLDVLDGYAHKMSEGHTFYDVYASGRLGAAIKAGKRYVCPYHVLRAGPTSGTAQANYFLDCCSEAGFDVTAKGVIVMNDWEGWSDGFATHQQAMDFAARVNQMVGRECVIHYGGLPNPYDMGDHIWLADYRTAAPSLNPLFPRAAVWQWGNKAAGGGDTNQIIDGAWLDHLAGYDLVPDPDDKDLPADSEVDMAVYVISYGAIPGLDDGGVYEIVAGARRHVSADEWTQVLKGVSQNRDGSWPPVNRQPTAGVANGWVLTGMPVYSAAAPTSGATKQDVKDLLEGVTLTIDFTTP